MDEFEIDELPEDFEIKELDFEESESETLSQDNAFEHLF